jgi:hypothetical protein
MASYAEFAYPRQILIGDGQRRQVYRIAGGLGHHPALPVAVRLRLFIARFRMAGLTELYLVDLNIILVRLRPGQIHFRLCGRLHQETQRHRLDEKQFFLS